MNKKFIINKTITFICIIAFIIGFKLVFGAENVFIAVTTVTALLMYLERDLTTTPIKNTMQLIAVNISMGVLSYIASSNMWLAIPINFFVMFFIGYVYSYNLRNSMCLPFGLQYLFILVNPVEFSALGTRLIALFVGAILIMLAQIIVNTNRVSKSGDKILISITENLIIKLNDLKNNKKNISTDTQIISLIDNFRKIIYDKRSERFYFTEEARIKLNISVSLEKVYFTLKKIDYSKHEDELYNSIEDLLKEIVKILNNESSYEILENKINNIFKQYEGEIKDNYILGILFNLYFIFECFESLNKLGKEKYNFTKKIEQIPENYKISDFAYEKPGQFSMRFKYALRVATGVVIGAFISDYFKLSEGRWIVLTIFSIIMPIYEVTIKKVKDRTFGTIIGAILIVILFSIVKDVTARTVLIMLNGYIGSYMKQYKYTTISTTISAIGAVAILGGTEILTITRVVYVILGGLIALFINRFYFSYKYEESQKDLKKMYEEIINEMLIILSNTYKNKESSNTMKNLLLATSLIEEKIKLNNELIQDSSSEKYVVDKRSLIVSIYELYLCIVNSQIEKEDMNYIKNNLKVLVNYEELDTINVISDIKKDLDKIKNTKDKMILFGILDIFNELKAA